MSVADRKPEWFERRLRFARRMFLSIPHLIPAELRYRETIKTIDREKFRAIAEKYSEEQYAKYTQFHRHLRFAFVRAQLLGLADSPPLRILDIGCGAGLFMLAAKRLGHQVEGLDIPDDPLLGALVEGLGLERTEGRIRPFERVPIEAKRFDLVTAFYIMFDHYKTKDRPADGRRRWGPREWSFFLEDVRSRLLTETGRIYLRLNYPLTRFPDMAPFFSSVTGFRSRVIDATNIELQRT